MTFIDSDICSSDLDLHFQDQIATLLLSCPRRDITHLHKVTFKAMKLNEKQFMYYEMINNSSLN